MRPAIHPDQWIGLLIVARTGTCPVCGSALGTVEGLDRHNEHASVGERSYCGRVALAKREGA